ncbi:MAG: ribosome maturation factor RimM [Bacteroidota bacterium]
MEKYIPVGFTRKCHGVKGELKVQVEEEYLEDFLKSSTVFFFTKGKHLPYFVEKVRIGNDTILKLEEVDSKESAQPLTSKEMYLQPHQILNDDDREIILEDELVFEKFVGHTIIDAALGDIGKIEAIIAYPQQEMAVILRDEKEVLIPLHEDLIQNIDEEKQCIYMDLPEGILEI